MKINIFTSTQGGPCTWGKDLAYSLNTKGISARSINKFKSLIFSPLFQDADIVHTSLPMTYRLWNNPVILTLHGEYTIEHNIWRTFYPKAIKKADLVTLPSQFLKERLGLDNAIVIPNAIFPFKFFKVIHQHKDIVNIVTVTNFNFRDKSQCILNIIGILNKIQKSVIKINYTIIGGGLYLDQIKRKAKEYNTVNIKFMGMLPNPGDIVRENDIFLYYSNHDNFPISVLEGMACGLPVVCNNVGAINEMIKDSYDGFVVNDEVEYKERLLDLICDYKLRQQIGRNSRESVEVNFDWKTITEKYIRLYNEL